MPPSNARSSLAPAAPTLVILTGAGVSAESGLPTFRDARGLWRGQRPEEVATPEAFARDSANVHAFYNARRRALLSAGVEPNAAHRALAELEARWPGEFLLITQNVDDLHERAGSRRLLHLHGEILKSLCNRCGHVAECREDLSTGTVCAACQQAGGVRPHVVWFGEMPLGMEAAYRALNRAGIFVAIGTSGAVYPAAGFVRQAKEAGAKRTILVNLEAHEEGGRHGAGGESFDERLLGEPASRAVPALVARLLGQAVGSFPAAT